MLNPQPYHKGFSQASAPSHFVGKATVDVTVKNSVSAIFEYLNIFRKETLKEFLK